MGYTDIWDELGKTDPAHTKKFQRAGGFKGTAIKPIYTERKMTEEFGPCGIGWGINEPTFQVVPGTEGQTAVYCTASIWIKVGEILSAPIYGVGGDMVIVKQSSGSRTDDEAFKKAFTDAIGNAMKHLGMSADVHMGLFDDSKYVREREEEERAERPPTVPARQNTDDSHGGEPVNSITAETSTGKSASQGRKDGGYEALSNELEACLDEASLATLLATKAFRDEYKKLPQSWKEHMNAEVDAAKARLAQKPGFVPANFDNLQP